MTDEPTRRQNEPKKSSGLYSDAQSKNVEFILSLNNESTPVAWKSRFEVNDKRVKPSDKNKASTVEETELERLSQTNKLRAPFMYSALAMVGAIILVSSVVVLILTCRGELETPMGIAFTVTLGIEVVGILAIIAHYLFSVPESYLLEKVKQAKATESPTDSQDTDNEE